ncbi:MAG: cyanophycin synthetase, partial [Patescibacteria group bacterium]
ELKKILKVPGEHNVSNALSALNVARQLGVGDAVSFKALGEFKGVWRRFQESKLSIANCQLLIVNDYAHHPTEIQATFQALYEKYPNKRIFVVFQPHQYQRTFYLFNDFVKTFQQAKNRFGIEKIIITDIYSVAGRESQAIKKKTSSQKLVKKIDRDFVEYVEQSKVGDYIKKNIKEIDVLTIMGAGNIYKLADELK